ncbi:MAG: STAS domain-containing protein [Verrucomicrobiae bacterium]|nr:STAS domain-containing protein [Verrucomicrobiae bacterium]
MQITRQEIPNGIILKLQGRLDASWAGSAAAAIEEAARAGCRDLRLDLADVSFLSSAGVRSLILAHRQMQSLRGKLRILKASGEVRTVLQLSGLDTLLLLAETESPPSSTSSSAPPPDGDTIHIEAGDFQLKIFSRPQGEPARGTLLGSPDGFAGSGKNWSSIQHQPLPSNVLSLGIGALASNADDASNRLGEFLSISGAVVCQPTDGSNQPDYLLASGAFTPSIQTLYAIRCEGTLSGHARFRPQTPGNSIPLSLLLKSLESLCENTPLAVVILAETAGLIGACLKKAPDQSLPPDAFFEHPSIRRRISFTPERQHARSLALAGGVIMKDAPGQWADFVRPLDSEETRFGHFHAMVLPGRPLPAGALPLPSTVANLFETGTPQAAIHLLRDSRKLGGGESGFTRGAIWFGPIQPQTS